MTRTVIKWYCARTFVSGAIDAIAPQKIAEGLSPNHLCNVKIFASQVGQPDSTSCFMGPCFSTGQYLSPEGYPSLEKKVEHALDAAGGGVACNNKAGNMTA